jgi:myosin-crossreactive antigen
MNYSSGNYEAFSRPRKPKDVEKKTACFVGSGLAALAGAAFLIRDGQMPGNQITILEQQQLPGGALDGIKEQQRGFVIRGGREMEEPSNACGTFTARSRRWRSRAPACSTSSIGSTRTIRTPLCSVPR